MQSKNNAEKRIIVGMSGGVDSSVSALLLKQQGYQVEGLFMKNWEEDDTDTYCSATHDLQDAQQVCDSLNIPLHRVNFSSDYWDHVFENFLEEYRAGRTPNPDILCNKFIKFTAFLDYAKHLGADYIATGHYAQKRQEAEFEYLIKAQDSNKDQTYFLYTLNQYQLKNTLFPIGHLEKNSVRQLAQKANLPNHAKKDSTGICFIGEKRFREFLSHYLPAQPGDIVTPEGKKIGTHQGLMYYTLGQRQGLGIGGLKNTAENPWYVADKHTHSNELVVVQGHDHPLLFSQACYCHTLHWIASAPTLPYTCHVKIRYRQQEQTAEIQQMTDNRYFIQFETPQRAVTPGQSAVFYQNDTCLGGGIIESIIRACRQLTHQNNRRC
ncbi:MAG: tRNA 2-thiouridine(34) synthase MnmA [Gammaproteobacteria bacterium]|nr:tRNA 2-thiouridine(34) synthase MnmA [Gammaproteobacteria bacterium]